MDHLLVFYHPEQQAAVDRLQYLLRTKIDVPSAQVYIETLVLEVSEEDSKELGISYENANIGSNSLLNLGATEVNEGDTTSFTRNTRTEDGINVFTPGTGIEVKLRALVDEGRAEILSRPSVLALSNRQAVIQIVDVVQTPILESTVTQSGDLVISSYNFEPLLLGITLNLRPRVSVDRDWISLEIDATVEAEVDENSGTAFAPDANGGRIALAEKKGSASRKVRTFARIPDRTPIIIGGLVAGNSEQMKSRVPGLGRLPLVGGLFGATDNEIQKREVIIVLTPHVLAEDAIGVASNRPRDDVMARVSDLMLFNNSYQVRAADIFDMNFLLDDPQYRAYREKALILNGTSPGLNADDPVTQLAEGHIPGERALVAKMLFDIISNSANRVSATVDQVFVPELAAGQNIRHTALAEVLESTGFAADDSSGVWLEFILQNGSNHVSYKAITRTPHDSWAGIESGLRHSLSAGTEGILLHDIADLERLKRSVAVDTVLRLNGGYRSLGVQNLRAGTVLKLGTPADYSNYELSSRTAQIYNDSQYYFNVLQSELTSTYEAMDTVLQKQELLR
jgi:general secretion pathway protein D